MHETSLVQALIRQVERLMADHDAVRVTEVSVSVGEFSGVDAELMQFAFLREIEGTALRDARLTLAAVPLEARCVACGHLFAVGGFRFECPRCESRHIEVVRGEEMVLETVVFDCADTSAPT
ncbi:MAG: hydrogenase maturation nickel metallochaperone HypA [Planctomycetales bacterium]|nr:hydrogenase maturation nickel metallochaperone HypA [Planctomycetales bacterium]